MEVKSLRVQPQAQQQDSQGTEELRRKKNSRSVDSDAVKVRLSSAPSERATTAQAVSTKGSKGIVPETDG